MRTVVTEVERGLHDGATVVLVSRQAPRLAEIFDEARHAIAPVEQVLTPPPPGLTVVQGVMDEGWRLEGGSWDIESDETDLPSSVVHRLSSVWFLTDAELFGWASRSRDGRCERARWRLRSFSQTSNPAIAWCTSSTASAGSRACSR